MPGGQVWGLRGRVDGLTASSSELPRVNGFSTWHGRCVRSWPLVQRPRQGNVLVDNRNAARRTRGARREAASAPGNSTIVRDDDHKQRRPRHRLDHRRRHRTTAVSLTPCGEPLVFHRRHRCPCGRAPGSPPRHAQRRRTLTSPGQVLDLVCRRGAPLASSGVASHPGLGTGTTAASVQLAQSRRRLHGGGQRLRAVPLALARIYRTPRNMGLQPTVAIIIPAYNEGPTIVETLSACAAVEYPVDKLDIVCVNDGSTDDTWPHMLRTVEQAGYRSVRCIDLPTNCGKRTALADGSAPLVLRSSSSLIRILPLPPMASGASSKYSQTRRWARSGASRTCVTPDATCSPGCRPLATTSPMTY